MEVFYFPATLDIGKAVALSERLQAATASPIRYVVSGDMIETRETEVIQQETAPLLLFKEPFIIH
jgi:hypothetical protein